MSAVVLIIVILILVRLVFKRRKTSRRKTVFFRWQTPTRKGEFSELLVDGELQSLPEEYVVFNNLLFRSNGRSTQIDHIVASPYGVFVIETKGYKGWIMGGENSQYWTQSLYRSKHRFYNPILQNESHVRFLRHLLNYSTDIPLIPIVCFDNEAKLKVSVENHIVVNRCELIKAITQHQNPIIDKCVIDHIVETINRTRSTTDTASEQQHLQNVKQRKQTAESSIQQGICPRCGGRIVQRQGRYGSFYGCSNYPECKFTLNEMP